MKINIKESIAKNREERRKEKELIQKVYNALFKMSTEDLIVHYEEIKKELIKRGVNNV